MSANPTLAQWQLAQELRALRGDRKFNDVVKAMRAAASSLARWETPGDGGAVPGAGTIERLLQIYGATDQLDRLLELRKQAREPDQWQPYDLERSYRSYANIEAQATSLEMYQSQLIPGLAQTEDYARAVIEATRRPESDVERELQVRLTRQEILQRSDPPNVWMIVTEAALRQQIGGPWLMADQVRHLMDLAQGPRVTLQVLPFSAGAHAALTLTSFVVLRVDQHGLETVYLQGATQHQFLTNEENIAHYSSIFNRLRASALDEGKATSRVLEQVVRDLEREQD
ncbi:helix-turn-helix transcriptional regulator [Nocardiopsis sp. RSe5-2]|uniref:Helix-turn-helix transcriptional regulator n=1 Tax=Nocardiopsis endophytica TaxID=3018445 RepID=A0ABT4U010_9ACTN|nr:helix-turn-helix transcriptional regulator [Nocardiopsis endophytica]MDA2810280.1 helix-turn-helix transcriptional regulator [Nocardiopsis endophytica]